MTTSTATKALAIQSSPGAPSEAAFRVEKPAKTKSDTSTAEKSSDVATTSPVRISTRRSFWSKSQTC